MLKLMETLFFKLLCTTPVSAKNLLKMRGWVKTQKGFFFQGSLAKTFITKLFGIHSSSRFQKYKTLVGAIKLNLGPLQ